MIDRFVDPTFSEPRCECGDCEACCKDWEWRCNGYTLEEGVRLAEFNYECQVYHELEKQKAPRY